MDKKSTSVTSTPSTDDDDDDEDDANNNNYHYNNYCNYSIIMEISKTSFNEQPYFRDNTQPQFTVIIGTDKKVKPT
jgi:hypothetical protein